MKKLRLALYALLPLMIDAAFGQTYPPAPPPSISTLTGPALRRDVARFLTQATFGPTKAEIDALENSVNTTYAGDRIAAFHAWIDAQMSRDQTTLVDHVRAVHKRELSLRGLSTTVPTAGQLSLPSVCQGWAWWTNALSGHDQLRQRFAFAASEIWVISRKTKVSYPLSTQDYGTSSYYDMLGSYANGNFRDMLESISKHPVMGVFLSSIRNQKAILDANGEQIVSPDENYAREIMQLFSIGLTQLRQDGEILTSSGNPIPNYTNDDIQNMARVFTGWALSKAIAPAPGYGVVDNTKFTYGASTLADRFFGDPWMNPMKNFAAYHDTGSKTLLGQTIPAGLSAEADLDAAHDLLFNHPSTPAFVSRALIQFFVTSNPSPGYVYRVAAKFINNGTGVRGDMKAVLKAILLDYEARDLTVASGGAFGKQKEPLLRTAQVLRSLRAKSQVPLSILSEYGYPASQLNNFPAGTTYVNRPGDNIQAPIEAPSVFNWFQPDYAPHGPIANAGLFAPEMQLTTETNVISLINSHRLLVEGTTINGATTPLYQVSKDLHKLTLDLAPLIATYDNAIASGKTVAQATETVLDELDDLFMAGFLKAEYGSAPIPNPRSILIQGVAGMSLSQTSVRIRELLYLVISSPEFIHQK